MRFMLRETRKKELKEHIYKTAIHLFRDKGFDEVTVKEITKACGIAKGTFYNYFARKEDIILHLGRSQIEYIHEHLERYTQIPVLKERLLKLFQDLMERDAEESELFRLTVQEVMRSSLHMREEMSAIGVFQDAVAWILRRAAELGELGAHVDPEEASSVLVGIYMYSLLTWTASAERPDRMLPVFRRRFEVVWRGLDAK
ncbi:TetR/AcrR family transcriptional regulator [Paenibacillus chitinolyticus]|uniref:TetR/AcrR family transcriptional regulator n=1 Tax=Paenibacillus chitinolyticus TaxID=79263 RepID=UPI00364B5B4F